MTDWTDYSPADFDASLAPKGAARKRAEQSDQGALFFAATPVTRPAKAATVDHLPGEVPLFGDDSEPES